MHLLIAAHDLYPDPGSGGSGRYIYETGRRLVDRGHRVSILTRRRGDQPRTDRVRGMEVYRYDLSIANRAFPAILRQLPSAVDTIRDHLTTIEARSRDRPWVISFQGSTTSLLTDALVPADRPRSLTFHSPWPTEYDLRRRDEAELAAPRRQLNVRLRRWLESRLVDAADHHHVLSRYMRGQLRHLYEPGPAVDVVPGGVDVERFTPDAGAFRPMVGAEFSLFTVRRLSPRMGHDLLLAAFAGVADERDDIHLFLAGDGPLRDRLERQARRLGVADRTTFLGFVPDDDLPSLYATGDLFVLPTTALEGFGLATLEALSSATPVVATSVGGTPEVLRGYEDLESIPQPMLVPSPTTDALADGLRRWIQLGSAGRAEAGRVCRRRTVQTYPWERTVDQLETRYARLLDGPT